MKALHMTSLKQFQSINDSHIMTLRDVRTYNSQEDSCFTDLQEAKFDHYKVAVAIPTKRYENEYAPQIRALHESWGSDMSKYIFERDLWGEPHTIIKLDTKRVADWSTPKIWDTKLNLITERLIIRMGSRLNVKINMRATEHQGTHYMQHQVKEVQVLELSEGESGGPGFEVEDGFVYDGGADVEVSRQAEF